MKKTSLTFRSTALALLAAASTITLLASGSYTNTMIESQATVRGDFTGPSNGGWTWGIESRPNPSSADWHIDSSGSGNYTAANEAYTNASLVSGGTTLPRE